MIIVCSGPDTYRAREKARELAQAFREKHDPQGLAMETVDGSEGLPILLSRLAGGSLFSKKKLIRADGCLEKMKIADVRTLAAKLAADKDATIILTVEEESPNEKTLDALKAAPLFNYPFVAQMGSSFRDWTRARAKTLGVDEKTADLVASANEGDSWRTIHELEKQAAYPHPFDARRDAGESSVFATADAIMAERAGWRSDVEISKEDGALSVAVGQIKSFIEVRDGQASAVHPYVAKKLSQLRLRDAEGRAAKLLRAFLSSRNGLAAGAETKTLL
ncbi:MAG: hypothetical protein ABIO72_03095 [Patescibacteria group bacterium]